MASVTYKIEDPQEEPIIIYVYGCHDCRRSFKSNKKIQYAGRFCHNCKIRHMMKNKVPMSEYENFTDMDFLVKNGLYPRVPNN